MTELFNNKYRIPSTRLSNWDYNRISGIYFITINTEGKICWFGKIHQNYMKLSILGKIAYRYWCEIPSHFKHVQLDKYVIMPNHIHGILIFGKINKQRNDTCKNRKDHTITDNNINKVYNKTRFLPCRDVACNVSTYNRFRQNQIL